MNLQILVFYSGTKIYISYEFYEKVNIFAVECLMSFLEDCKGKYHIHGWIGEVLLMNIPMFI